ncbi:DUF4340 domain-containing protein [Elongatibacter sediminis]|uniref:DUF4340 domain-containing protein n=1 Tax=Elongatibacter sediminis TaxID=3119006 RepID=A0AAW9R7G4_9GAMM
MSRKHFSWLLGLTVVAAVVIGLMPERAGRQDVFEKEVLLPDLAGRVNEIDEIRVTAAGDKRVATLRRTDTRWTVEEAGGYPADWSRLRSLLADFAQAQVVEPKTANPEYYERLGLRDVSDPDSAAVLIRLGGSEDATAVLVGESASNREGQYVRLADGDRALLIDRALDVPAETRDWLDRDFIDIPESDVVEVTITHPDGDTVRLARVSADESDFTLENLPPDREAESSWTVNAPAGGLGGLRLDEVRPATDADFEAPVAYELLTADGLRVTAELSESDEQHWIRLHAVADANLSGESGAADAAEGGASTEPGAEESDESAPVSATERAADINARVGGWAYAIPKYKFDVLTRRLEDLLKPLPEAED